MAVRQISRNFSTVSLNPLSLLRNVGICAHIDAGKTTTTEMMLVHSGAISRGGSVDGGDTVTDFLPQERERGITIKAAAVTFGWRGHTVNLIDTPGHVDFTVEVERSFRVLDGAVALYDAVSGVEAQSETVWVQASRYGVARIGFVNKMDRPGASFLGTSRAIERRLGVRTLPLHLPLGTAGEFTGCVDLLSLEAFSGPTSPRVPLHRSQRCEITGSPVPTSFSLPGRCDGATEAVTFEYEEVLDAARQARGSLLESLADLDDRTAEAFLSSQDPLDDMTSPGLRPQDLRATVRRIVCSFGGLTGGCNAPRAIPLLAGSAARAGGKGIPALLDAVIDYLPSPLDKTPLVGMPLKTTTSNSRHLKYRNNNKGLGNKSYSSSNSTQAPPAAEPGSPPPPSSSFLVLPDPSAPMRALAFKVQAHASRGPLVFFRVYSGILTRALPLWNTSAAARGSVDEPARGGAQKVSHTERPTRLLQLFGDGLREVESVGAGCIGAASGLKSVSTGDTLVFAGDPHALTLAPLTFPPPVFTAALETCSFPFAASSSPYFPIFPFPAKPHVQHAYHLSPKHTHAHTSFIKKQRGPQSLPP